MLENVVKTRWDDGEETLGLWLTLPDPLAVEWLGSLAFDYLCIDLQHGLIDYERTVAIAAALRQSTATPLVRVPWNEPGIIGKVLDAGAMGVVIPMVNTAAEAEAAVAAVRYPPRGRRSYGPTRADLALGPDYFLEANDQVLCIPMIETAEAVENLDAIVAVEGIDAIYVGPADLSLSMGLLPPSQHHPGNHCEAPLFTETLMQIVAACRRHGVVAGIHSQPDLVDIRRHQGFSMITVTSDLSALLRGARLALETAAGE